MRDKLNLNLAGFPAFEKRRKPGFMLQFLAFDPSIQFCLSQNHSGPLAAGFSLQSLPENLLAPSMGNDS